MVCRSPPFRFSGARGALLYATCRIRFFHPPVRSRAVYTRCRRMRGHPLAHTTHLCVPVTFPFRRRASGRNLARTQTILFSMRLSRRVVVTGLGAVTPLGNSVPEFWSNVVAGKSAVGPITLFDAAPMPTRFAAEVKGFDPAALIGKKDARKMDRFAQFAFVAAQQAIADSGLQIDDDNRDDIGVIMGSGIGGLATIEAQHTVMMEHGPGKLSPFLIPMLIGNIAPG